MANQFLRWHTTGTDAVLVRMWNDDQTTHQIGRALGVSSKRIANRAQVLRRAGRLKPRSAAWREIGVKPASATDRGAWPDFSTHDVSVRKR